MQDQTEEGPENGLDWRDGRIPVSRRFDDPYFSVDDGLAETAHVFLAGNGLPARFTAHEGPFRIGELGFGTGLNLAVTLAAWNGAHRPCPLHFTTFEAFPLARPVMARALGAFSAIDPAEVFAAMEGTIPGVTFTLIAGDARTTLPGWQGRVDAWFLDGFAPARNPEMWGDMLMAEVARHMEPGATLATYTAAGHVRRALAIAGLEVARLPGYGRKRHMTTARKPPF